MNEKALQARKYHEEGYNCCQSVIKPFIIEMDVDEEQILKAASSLGGGLGYLREVCGAVSGMAIVLGLKYGYQYGFKDEMDKAAKAEHYARVKQIGEEFKRKAGALTCRALLHMDENDVVLPEFADVKKPCSDLVATAADILAAYIEKKEEA